VGARFEEQAAVFSIRSGPRFTWSVEGMPDPPDLAAPLHPSLFEEEALEKGRAGEVYNFGARSERHNIHIVQQVLALLGKPESLVQYVKDRPGHDRRYAIDPRKAEGELGWAPGHRFEEALSATVRWYVEHRAWWERILTGEYLRYYEKQYGGR
jgi:dTDP-D-glucose 4,6-dehydratase